MPPSLAALVAQLQAIVAQIVAVAVAPPVLLTAVQALQSAVVQVANIVGTGTGTLPANVTAALAIVQADIVFLNGDLGVSPVNVAQTTVDINQLQNDLSLLAAAVASPSTPFGSTVVTPGLPITPQTRYIDPLTGNSAPYGTPGAVATVNSPAISSAPQSQFIDPVTRQPVASNSPGAIVTPQFPASAANYPAGNPPFVRMVPGTNSPDFRTR